MKGATSVFKVELRCAIRNAQKFRNARQVVTLDLTGAFVEDDYRYEEPRGHLRALQIDDGFD